MFAIFALLVVLVAFASSAPASTDTSGTPLRGAALLAKTNENYNKLNGKAPDHYQKRADFLKANKGTVGAAVKDRLDQNREKFLLARENQKKNRVPGAPAEHVFTKKPRQHKTIAEINIPLGLHEVFLDGDQEASEQQLKEIFGLQNPQATAATRGKRQTFMDSMYPTDTWTQGIPYFFDAAFPTSRIPAVQTAIAFWQANTCLKFTQVSGPSATTIRPVVRFFNGSGCYSPIGRITDTSTVTQDISLGDGCDPPGIAAHEIGHSIGMYHAQSRYDRDQWISVNTSNVEPDNVFNYDEVTSSTNNNFGMRYDYRSIMHYDPEGFAIDPTVPVMQAFDMLAQYSMGSSRMPVFTDIVLINDLYKCYDRCSSSGTVCKNGGMPNPNKCTVCQCPSGFAGNDCSGIAPANGVVGSCGGSLTATTAWTDLTANCTWHIMAPVGKFVQFYVQSVGASGQNDTFCSSDCHFAGVDIKWDSNKQPEGYRICCPDSYYWMAQSSDNRLVVQAYNYWFYTDFTLTYRIAESDRPEVRDVFRAIQSKTCLTFKEVPFSSVTKKSETTIAFSNGTKCTTAQIGKNGAFAMYPIVLSEDMCRMPVNYFEHIFYALGLQSTQQRSDRDDYITVYEDRILPERRVDFEKYSPENSKNFDVPYDFDSLMHVTPDVLRINDNEPTIIAKDPLYQSAVGRNIYAASHSDYLQLNRLYKCLDKCEADKTACENGGYVNPHKCSECSCPRGFTGPLCTELDYSEATHKGCGGQIDVTDSWKELSIQREANENNISCHWFFHAPKGKNIEIKISIVAPENQRCTTFTKTWLEIRFGNFIVGGYKFFCQDQLPKLPIKNLGDFVVVTLSQDYDDPTEFSLLYRTGSNEE
ncbi:hypothetical protein QR680_015540 [Steinernema hermaphroditum]|uniref:Metalloendopeptidase n=1 Tax=Steinernema hermaphroditum TaxID=289476 RepID=A0AA39LL19_9BILA|nr:hypothetical protein QR680_015540 [Steinernema hermaphroditum]